MIDLAALDLALFYLINHGWANPLFDAFFPFITRFQNFWIPLLALVAWLAVRGGRRGRICLLAVGLTVAVTDPLTVRVLKPAVDRERPCIALDDVRLLASRKRSPSFPSAHAVNAFGAATVFFLFYRRSVWIALPFAVLEAISRVYIGVHYPSDTIAGAVLGVLAAWLVVRALRLAAVRFRWLALAPNPPPR